MSYFTQHNMMNVKVNGEIKTRNTANEKPYYIIPTVYYSFGGQSKPLFMDFFVFNEKLFNKVRCLKKDRYISISFNIEQKVKDGKIEFNNYSFVTIDFEFLDLPEKKETVRVEEKEVPLSQIEPQLSLNVDVTPPF